MLPVLLILGVQIGLMMGFTGLSRKKAAALILGIGGGLLLVTYLTRGVVDQVPGFIQNYSSALVIILAAILLYTGFSTLKNWKTSSTSLGSVAAILLASPLLVTSTLVIGGYGVLLLMGVLTTFYLGSSRLTRNQHPQILLGNFMLLAGFYFLASALVIPNINTVSTQEMSALVIPDFWMLVYALLTLVIMVGAGFYLNRRYSPLLRVD